MSSFRVVAGSAARGNHLAASPAPCPRVQKAPEADPGRWRFDETPRRASRVGHHRPLVENRGDGRRRSPPGFEPPRERGGCAAGSDPACTGSKPSTSQRGPHSSHRWVTPSLARSFLNVRPAPARQRTKKPPKKPLADPPRPIGPMSASSTTERVRLLPESASLVRHTIPRSPFVEW